MITYAYWILVIGLTIAAFVVIGRVSGNWKASSVTAALLLVTGTAAYFFHFQQIFVKRFGGVMTVTVPAGQRHLTMTWKDENLWVENYDPATNTCYFTEYSRGDLLQGRVTIKQCNPLLRQ